MTFNNRFNSNKNWLFKHFSKDGNNENIKRIDNDLYEIAYSEVDDMPDFYSEDENDELFNWEDM